MMQGSTHITDIFTKQYPSSKAVASGKTNKQTNRNLGFA